MQFDGKYFEAGGSIIHPANKHAIQIMKNYNLQRKTVGDSLPGILGAGNDGHLKWSFLPSGSIFDIVKFLYFYGVDILYRIPTMVHPLIAKLDGIYKLQQDGYGYKSFNELFSRLGLLDYTKLSGEEMFQSIPKKTRDGTAKVITIVNPKISYVILHMTHSKFTFRDYKCRHDEQLFKPNSILYHRTGNICFVSWV